MPLPCVLKFLQYVMVLCHTFTLNGGALLGWGAVYICPTYKKASTNKRDLVSCTYITLIKIVCVYTRVTAFYVWDLAINNLALWQEISFININCSPWLCDGKTIHENCVPHFIVHTFYWLCPRTFLEFAVRKTDFDSLAKWFLTWKRFALCNVLIYTTFTLSTRGRYYWRISHIAIICTPLLLDMKIW